MTSHEEPIGRRRFLRFTGAAAAAAAGSRVLLAPTGALGVELSGALTAHEADTLQAMLRRLYPHASLGDRYYLNAVAVLDEQANDSAETRSLLKDGVAKLDRVLTLPFVQLSDGYRLKALRAIEDSPFFAKVRSTAVTAIYDQKLVWRQLGYEGASYPHGGYIERGFNDLAWLPEPPADASPPPYS